MKEYFRVACITLLLTGCSGTAVNRNIVSPSMPEDEAARHVRTLPAIGPLSASKEEPVLPPEAEHDRISSSEDEPLHSRYAQKALIILLEKKGIITSEELNAEIKRLKAK